jgi:hypothetical protein
MTGTDVAPIAAPAAPTDDDLTWRLSTILADQRPVDLPTSEASQPIAHPDMNPDRPGW